MKVILSSFKRLADFKGKTSKRDFKIWSVFCVVSFIVFAILTLCALVYGVYLEENSYDPEMGQTYFVKKGDPIFIIMMLFYAFDLLIVNLFLPAALVRRLRDAARPVAIALLAIIPNLFFSLIPVMVIYDFSVNLMLISLCLPILEILPLIAIRKESVEED